MEEEKEQDGLTFAGILHAIGKKIWWILGISVVVAIVVALLTVFVSNPKQREYQMSFTLEYPDKKEMKIPGTSSDFRFDSFIYAEKLEAVKQSDESFSNIDVDAMTAKGAISIAEETRDQRTETGIYVIRIKGNYFKNTKQATDFIRALCNYTCDELVGYAAKMKYGAALASYDSLPTYDAKIQAIERQQKILLSTYDAYMENYGDYVAVNGQLISTYRAELSAALENKEVRLSIVKADLSNNRYLLTEKEADVMQTIRTLEIEREKNELQIKALNRQIDEYHSIPAQVTGADDEYAPFFAEVATLTKRNAEIDTEIKELYASVGKNYVYNEAEDKWTVEEGERPDATKFEEDLAKLYAIMQAQTKTCEDVVHALYANQTHVSFFQSSTSIGGGSGYITRAVIGFVAAFLLASVVFVCLDRTKQNKMRIAVNTGAAKEDAQAREGDAETSEKE